MLYWLAQFLQHYISVFHVFTYITFRAICSSLTALVLALITGPAMINWLRKNQIGQVVRSDGPQSHLEKAGTPTMGGAFILLSVSISVLLWGNLANYYVWLVLLVTLGFGAIGWVDDYKKLILKDSKGISARTKLLSQSIIGLIAIIILYVTASTPQQTELLIPFTKNILLPLGWFYIVLGYFVIVGTSNAVNLTDGLDGLAILPIVLVAGALGIFAYVVGNVEFAKYLDIPFINGVGEVAVYCSALVGAGLGFLWFNTYPAQVFMGDVGALGLGAGLGIVAVVVRQEIVLFIMGGLFVVETLSVIMQVASFKLTGKRIFRMAPLHHHFELKGWPEPRVIVRFWIITVMLVLIGLATLKLR